MEFRYIFMGLIFLFNPNINVFDLLPDFIGFGFMLYGLRKLRDMSSDLDECFRDCLRLLCLSAAKFLSVFAANALNDEGFLMVFTLCFTAAELYFLLRMFSLFFNGLFFLGVNDDVEVFVKNINSPKIWTTVFVIIRSVSTLLPELCYLSIDEAAGYVLAPYKGVLYIFSVLLSLSFGIVWLIIMRHFQRYLQAEEAAIGRLMQRYDREIAPNTSLFLLRRARHGLLFIGLGVLFLCDFYTDGKDLLPDVLGGLLLLSGLYFLRKYFPMDKKLPLLAGGLTILTAIDGLYVGHYADKYNAIGAARIPEAFRMYLGTILFSVLVSAMTALFLWQFVRYFLGLIADHTGRAIESRFASLIAQDKHTRKMLRVKTYAFLIFGLLTAASGIAYTVCLFYWPTYWIINIALSIGWGLVTVKAFYDTYYQMETKYL